MSTLRIRDGLNVYIVNEVDKILRPFWQLFKNERVMFIKKLSDKNKMIIFLIFLIAFFLILTIWYSETKQEEEKLVIAKSVKEIITTNEINIGLYNGAIIENIDAIEMNNETIRYLSNLIYNGLFEYNEDGVLESKLVAEYAQIDEKNYVFKLKEDIQFHDGKNLTSKDVKNTIENIFKNQNSYYIHSVDNIQSVKIIDNSTFRINLIESEEEFQKNLIFPILSEKINIGTNEYRVKEIISEKVILENNSTGQALNIYIYNNLKNLYGDFKNKKLDLIKAIEGVKHSNYIGEFGYKEKEYQSKNFIYLDFNTESYFKDSKIKDAVFSAINCKEITTKIFNGDAYDVKKIPYDLDNAVEILENSRYVYKNDGWYNKEKILNLRILLNKNLLTNLEIAYIIKEQLEKIGIKIELIIVEDEEYYKRIEAKDFDVLISNYKLKFYTESNSEIENAIICNKLKLLYSSNLSGKITPTERNIFYNIDTWKKFNEKFKKST